LANCEKDAETAHIFDDVLPTDSSSCRNQKENVTSNLGSDDSTITTAAMQNGVGKRPQLQQGYLDETGECTERATNDNIDNNGHEKNVNSTESNVEDMDIGKIKAKNKSLSAREIGRAKTRSVTTQHSYVTKKSSWKAPTKSAVSTG